MNKLPVKKIVEFRRFSERRKSTFAHKLKTSVEEKSKSDGGNYWVRSISALSTAFKFNNNQIIKDRIESLEHDYEKEERKQTKVMYQRNIEILYNYENYDFSIIRPNDDLNFLSKPTYKSLLKINEFLVQILPNHVFSYMEKERLNVGAIWFVTWLDGYKISDLGIYAETVYIYLKKHYSKDFNINPKDCMIMDISGMQLITYDEILKGQVPSLLNSTLDNLKNLS